MEYKVGEYWWVESTGNLYRIEELNDGTVWRCTFVDGKEYKTDIEFTFGSNTKRLGGWTCFTKRDDFRTAVYKRRLDREAAESYHSDIPKGKREQ